MTRIDRRDFLKLGALFVPVVAAPTVAYSFLREPLAFGGPRKAIAALRATLLEYTRAGWILTGHDGCISPSLVTIETLRPGEQPKAFEERVARFQAGTPQLWPPPYPGEQPSVRVE